MTSVVVGCGPQRGLLHQNNFEKFRCSLHDVFPSIDINSGVSPTYTVDMTKPSGRPLPLFNFIYCEHLPGHILCGTNEGGGIAGERKPAWPQVLKLVSPLGGLILLELGGEWSERALPCLEGFEFYSGWSNFWRASYPHYAFTPTGSAYQRYHSLLIPIPPRTDFNANYRILTRFSALSREQIAMIPAQVQGLIPQLNQAGGQQPARFGTLGEIARFYHLGANEQKLLFMSFCNIASIELASDTLATIFERSDILTLSDQVPLNYHSVPPGHYFTFMHKRYAGSSIPQWMKALISKGS